MCFAKDLFDSVAKILIRINQGWKQMLQFLGQQKTFKVFAENVSLFFVFPFPFPFWRPKHISVAIGDVDCHAFNPWKMMCSLGTGRFCLTM